MCQFIIAAATAQGKQEKNMRVGSEKSNRIGLLQVLILCLWNRSGIFFLEQPLPCRQTIDSNSTRNKFNPLHK